MSKFPENVTSSRMKEITADVKDIGTGDKTVEHSSGEPNFIAQTLITLLVRPKQLLFSEIMNSVVFPNNRFL